MEFLLQNVNVPSENFKCTTIQKLMINAKKHNETSETNIKFWTEVTESLWIHLENTLQKFDDQLLGATCLFTILPIVKEKDFYLKKFNDILIMELNMKDEDFKESNRTYQAVSLMYGMYQSAFLTKEKQISEILVLSLSSTFNLLLKFCYDYSRYTFISFKTLSSLKKVSGSHLENIVLTKENKIRLLHLVNHNWENPISGVRDLNSDIFLMVIPTLDEGMYKTVFEEINKFYWNKAKYLMLSIIIQESKGYVVDLVQENKWVDGLVNSLHKQGLVSAGADMYFAIFKNLRTVEEWTKLFEKGILDILKGFSSKAIEHFTNYWCITSLKRFPSILDILIQRLEKLKESQNKLLSTLCLYKQANKIGLVHKDWKASDYKQTAILKGLTHSNNYIRMLAFDIVCVRQCKTMPEETEYKMVFEFLHNNINSDCTVLRLNTLSSFNTFLTEIHMIYLNSVKNDRDMKNFEIFCKDFQELLLYSLNLNGNYQRKLSSIKLVKIFLNSLSEVPRKRQKQTKQSNVSLLEVLKKKNMIDIILEDKFVNTLIDILNDPADDIRENVTDLLLNHYISQLREPKFIKVLIERALRNNQSKFFYEISCGKSMFKLITNVMIKEKHIDAAFKTIEDVFNYAHSEFINESKINRGAIESIEKGKQLHSYISIMQVVIEVSKQNNYNFQITNQDTLAIILSTTSNQFLQDEAVNTSTDFSKMSDMVENIIKKSGYDSDSKADSTKISGLHQIVLNCLWLNVKASCDLSSLLIQNQTKDENSEVCEKFLKIIIHVLETCRHKGAIEAAGVSLSQSIKYLTSLPEDSKLSRLPYILLKNKLQELILDGSKMASITRRGAGLSIMVHRIVSSDTNKSKPLFHYFMKTLLDTCNKAADVPFILTQNDAENEKDLPKAIYIHFLTKIVTDSSLASDMLYYSAQLAALAYDNLTSPHWQIRNAALQLYGALVPKLIGQRKPSGTGDENISTVSIDELRTHSPELWKFIQIQITKINVTDKIQHDSNLVPILNMLANIARRYNFTQDVTLSQPSDALLKGLFSLLNSPIMTVRRLTAKTIFNIYSLEIIYERLCGIEICSENLLHGCLELMKNYYKQYYLDPSYFEHFKILNRKFYEILSTRRHSYLCKEMFERTYMQDLDWHILKQTISEVSKYCYEPGVHLWANQRFRIFIDKAHWSMIPETLRLILSNNEFENYCKNLFARIDRESSIPVGILEEVTDILLSFENKFKSSIIWKILYQVSKKLEQPQIKNREKIFEIIKYIKINEISYKLRYIIPFLSRELANSCHVEGLDHISKVILTLTDAETTDVEMRYIAAVANNELVLRLFELPLKLKLTAFKSVLILLQDEDEDIRQEAIKFYGSITKSEAPHPFLCLTKLIDYNFLLPILGEIGIETLCLELNEIILKYSSCTAEDKYNPFTNDFKNLYLEVAVNRQLVTKLKIK